MASEIPESASIEQLADAVLALAPKPRLNRWASLSLCVVDAVWSINLGYESYVLPAVYSVARDLGISHPSVPITEPIDDPAPLSVFLERYADPAALVASTSRHRTSTRSGILKADAALQYAATIRESADTLDEAMHLIATADRLDAVNAQLSKIPGEGQDEVRRGYLWMLVGDSNAIKPDRMVLRWFEAQGVHSPSPAEARQLVGEIVTLINAQPDSPRNDYTAWEIDKAVWEAGRELPALGRRRRLRGGLADRGARADHLSHELWTELERAAAQVGMSADVALRTAISDWIAKTARGQ